MNDFNFTGVRMKKKDWKLIPAYLRKVTDGKMVLASVGGKQAFVRVLIVD